MNLYPIKTHKLDIYLVKASTVDVLLKYSFQFADGAHLLRPPQVPLEQGILSNQTQS